MGLSVGEREAYERDGYVVRRDVLPGEVIEEIKSVFAVAVERRLIRPASSSSRRADA